MDLIISWIYVSVTGFKSKAKNFWRGFMDYINNTKVISSIFELLLHKLFTISRTVYFLSWLWPDGTAEANKKHQWKPSDTLSFMFFGFLNGLHGFFKWFLGALQTKIIKPVSNIPTQITDTIRHHEGIE